MLEVPKVQQLLIFFSFQKVQRRRGGVHEKETISTFFFYTYTHTHIPPSERSKNTPQENPAGPVSCVYISRSWYCYCTTKCRLGNICAYPPEEEGEKSKLENKKIKKFYVPPGRWMGGIGGRSAHTADDLFFFLHRERENSLTDMFIKVGTFWLVEMWPHSGISIP